NAGRHVHDFERWRLRLDALDTDPQRTAVGHSRHASHRRASRREERSDRGAADDVSRALLRSSSRGRQGSGDVPRARQGVPGRPAALHSGAVMVGVLILSYLAGLATGVLATLALVWVVRRSRATRIPPQTAHV